MCTNTIINQFYHNIYTFVHKTPRSSTSGHSIDEIMLVASAASSVMMLFQILTK